MNICSNMIERTYLEKVPSYVFCMLAHFWFYEFVVILIYMAEASTFLIFTSKVAYCIHERMNVSILEAAA